MSKRTSTFFSKFLATMIQFKCRIMLLYYDCKKSNFKVFSIAKKNAKLKFVIVAKLRC